MRKYLIILPILSVSLVLGQDDEDLNMDDLWDTTVWEEIEEINEVEGEVEQVVTVAGVRGAEAEDEALHHLYYRKSMKGPNKMELRSALGQLMKTLTRLGKNNQTFNINGDTAASAIAKKLKSRMLILMTNVKGVYDDKKKLISEIKPLDLENLIKWKIVEGGMIPKIENCVDAVENGVRGVVILDGRKPHSILHEIFSDTGSGTLIRK